MNIPNLPTGHLYKFMAFGGIALLVGSLGFIHIKRYRLEQKLTTIEIMLPLKEEEVGFISGRPMIDPEPVIESTDYSGRLLEIEGKLIRFDSTRGNEELRRLVAEARGQITTYYTIRPVACGVAIGALIATYIGFQLWYIKLRKYRYLTFKRVSQEDTDGAQREKTRPQ